MKLTVADCKKAQRKLKNGYGDAWPYKGRGIYFDGSEELPEDYVFVYISTWGIHIRHKDDVDYMNDL